VLDCAFGSRHIMNYVKPIIGLLLLFTVRPVVFAQNSWEHGGFLRESGRIYARTPNPGDAYAEGQAHFQVWGRAPIRKNLSVRGVFDLRMDTHRNVDRSQGLDWGERGLRQPAGSVSEFYLDAKVGHLDLRLGKQRIRWGRADGLNPADNIIPYDYLETFDDQRLAVPALKADIYFSRANIELVWLPYFMPTRLPLLGQRWFPQLPSSAPVSPAAGTEPVVTHLFYRDLSGPLPARTFGNGQWGVRWNQVLPKGEFSFSYFDGFDDLPFFRSALTPSFDTVSVHPQALVSFRREYYRVHVAGADFASGIGPVGIRGEAAYFDQTDPLNFDHLLFVIGVDKNWGDWSIIAQYAGQKVNDRFANAAIFPDLGVRSTLICRVERTLGSSRSFEMKGALRLLDGDFFVQPLYSMVLSNSWRVKLGATIFAGSRFGYLGQFRDSSHLNLQLIYSW
jgi:hypothetical protein